jgi:hypothetical protein
MNKYFLILFALLSYQILSPNSASAHILTTDQNIGAVIHIDPEDDPIANSPSIITFDIKDKEGNFTFENCDCTVKVIKQGEELEMLPLTRETLTYTFPEKNIYTLILTGSPKEKNTFQKFSLSYDVRVERSANTSATEQKTNPKLIPNWLGKHTIHFLGAFTMLGIVVYSILKNRSAK